MHRNKEEKRARRIRDRQRMIARAYRKGLLLWRAGGPDGVEKIRDFAREYAQQNHRHLAACSCHMCGNPRRYWGEVTMPERRAAVDAEEQLREVVEG